MAALIDAVGILSKMGFYQTIFPWLLVTAMMYGLLTKYKMFGEKSGTINIIISSIVGLVFISFVKASLFLQNVLPFVTAFIIMLFFLMMIFLFVGVKEETIGEAFKQPSLYWPLVLIFLVFTFIVIPQIFPELAIGANPELASQLNYTANQQPQDILFQQSLGIIFSPKVVGLSIMILIFAIGTYFITREQI
ncbi:MAG: hypothetical protein HY438_02695 [DPANN group archaeon]|nr:hypothetical protein [DPANN group archaeon]